MHRCVPLRRIANKVDFQNFDLEMAEEERALRWLFG